MSQFRKYNTTTQVYFVSDTIERVQQCNGITFTNIGDTIATVNGQIIYPGTVGSVLGDSRSIGGNEGEIYSGNIQLQFDTVAPGVKPQVEIIQKYYVD